MQEFKEASNGNANHSKVGEYITKVCEQIRWKRAHDSISDELFNHIEDQKTAFLKKGQKEDEAEKNAVLEMGDAVTVGQLLDRTHRPKPDWGIFAIVGVCILVSIVLNYFISLNATEDQGYLYSRLYHYLNALPFGIVAMFVMYFVDYSIIGRYPKILYGSVLAVCVLLFNFAPQLNYVYVHVFYFALLLIPLYAGVVYSQRGKGYLGLVYCGAVGVISCIIFLIGPSSVGARIFSISGAVILTAAIRKDWFQVNKKIALSLVWGSVIFVILYPFIFFWRRFKYMFITKGGEHDYAYLLKIAREFLSNSKLVGQGSFPSYFKGLKNIDGSAIEGVLQSWYNDYSLTYMIHKFGWFVAVIVIMLVVLLVIRMFKIVNKQSSQLGYIVSLGVAMTVLGESVNFLFANLGICSWISHPLPLISPGNISFIVNMGLMGLILSVCRNNSIVRDKSIQTKSIGKCFIYSKAPYKIKIGKWELLLRKNN